jgi:RND family efflux transporter MFP subunit
MRVVLLAVALLAITSACAKKEPERAESAASPPIPVTTVPAAARQWPDVYEAVGTVRARATSPVSSRMLGYVREVRVRLGDAVAAGQVLVTLEAQDIDTQIRQAEAALAEARSAQPEIESAVAAAKAQLDLAQTTFERMQDLFAKRSVSNQEYDEAAAKLKLANANHEMAQAKRAQLTAKIAQAEQALRAAEIHRGYASIVAPFAGIIVEKPVEPGTLATPGAPLLVIEQSGGWRLEASIEESRLGAIRIGQSAEVQVEAVGKLPGRVAEIVPAVDPASRTFIAKIDLPQRPQLRGGQFGRARFTLGRREVLTVPAAAIATRGQLQMVYVAESGRARARMVTTGAASDGEIEVLSGLSGGETVIAPVPAGLGDGTRIEVRP